MPVPPSLVLVDRRTPRTRRHDAVRHRLLSLAIGGALVCVSAAPLLLGLDR